MATVHQILMRITPNIPLWPDLDPNPLRSFLASLDKTERLPARLVLPGHRQTFSDLSSRVHELRAHHTVRAQACWEAAGAGSTAFEICMRLFPGIQAVDDVRMAMVETLAHLEYLVAESRLERLEGDVTRYRQFPA